MDSKELEEIKNKVEELYNWYKSQGNSIIKIDLPESNIKRTTIRINEKIWDDFDEFCENHKPYDKHTLMAQALKEYMEKYEEE